jgi:type II secretory pathway pseudopilin PulG
MTIVELLVVIAIVGIAAAAAVPAFRAADGAAAAAEALTDEWRRARGDAVRRGVPVEVVLEGTGAWVERTAPGDGSAPDTLRTGTLPLPDGARVRGGAVRFDALGRARADRVTIEHGREIHVAWVDPWTGAARRDAR